MNKIRSAMTAALIVGFSLAVYGILRGAPYIAEVSWVVLIGMLTIGVIIFGPEDKHGKEVRA